jgi:hypothetical protein
MRKPWLSFAVPLAIAAWWLLRAGDSATHDDREALATAVMSDIVATDGDGIQWLTDGGLGASSGVGTRGLQDSSVKFRVSSGMATVETATWRVNVYLYRITEIVCERRYIHHPEPPLVLLYVSFRKGEDDEDGYPDELFSVRFDESREPAIDELCRKHGLRREGDW